MAALSLCASMSAAEISVISTQKLEVADAYHPTLSPNGDLVLFTTDDYKGLKSFNFETKEIKELDANLGAGFDPVFSADGQEIVYRSVVRQDGLVRRDVKRISLATDRSEQLMAPTRELVNTRAIVGDTYAYGLADKQAIEVSVDGMVSEINPIVHGYRYLWTSVSPSKDKLLFKEVYSGLYVSNLDGSKAVNLGSRADFPCWAGDKYVVALKTTDDGYVITSAKIIAIEVETGKVTELTGDDVLVSGVSATANKIVYTTETGEMYIMNILIAE